MGHPEILHALSIGQLFLSSSNKLTVYRSWDHLQKANLTGSAIG